MLLLNIDLGELPDEPDELYALAHVANIACGGHAGDAASMARALALCAQHGAAAGAHPSYPDRDGFGRRRLALDGHALRTSVAEQCDALEEIADRAGIVLGYVKPHGALYHAADADDALAHAVVGGAIEALGYEIRVIGPAGGALARACEAAGVALLREGFADRGVRADGTLVPRGDPGALIADPAAAAARAAALAQSGAVDTVCVHGDSPGAVAIARAVRAALGAERAAPGRA